MDSQRNLFFIAFLFVSFMVWQTWHTDHNPQPQAQQTTQNTNTPAGDAANQASNSGQGKTITVTTDVLSLQSIHVVGILNKPNCWRTLTS